MTASVIDEPRQRGAIDAEDLCGAHPKLAERKEDLPLAEVERRYAARILARTGRNSDPPFAYSNNPTLSFVAPVNAPRL
jgi:hypothetical protein